MIENDWRERFIVSDAEMDRLQEKISEAARAYYADSGSQIDSVSVTFHFMAGPSLRFLEVSVAGGTPLEISDDALSF